MSTPFLKFMLPGFLALLLVACGGRAETARTVTSPDGRLAFHLESGEGALTYRVTRGDEVIVRPSRLGFRFRQAAPLGDHMTLVDTTITRRDRQWEQPWGEKRMVRDHHVEARFTLRETAAPGRTLVVVARLFNDGLGFRYELPAGADADDLVVTDERTAFNLPMDATSWWIPAREWNRYEYIYEETPLAAVEEAHTPITLKTAAGTHVSVHEAALVDYAGITLKRAGDGFEADLAPWPNGDKVRTSGGFTTPWRTFQIADDATGLMASDLILNLNEPNRLGDVDWVEPGKYVGIWWAMHIRKATWGRDGNHGATTENTMRYMDFAAEHGFDGVLVEGWNKGWDGDWYSHGELFDFTTPYPDFDLSAVAEYGRKKGVRLIGHHETSGHITNYEDQMDAAFRLLAEHGVRQVKTGYVADAGEAIRVLPDGSREKHFHDGQYMVNHYQRVLEVAAKYNIAINTHEPVKATGLRRTYPNWISREGARGQEYNAWGDPTNPPSHTATLPFTRMLGGPMDFTPGIFDLLFKDEMPDHRVKTTLAKQLALYVVLYSPIQMAADLPENYEARPEAFQFIKDVPTDWEDSIPLEGVVGDHVTVARKARGGDDWFLGSLTADKARTMTVALDFLDGDRAYEARIYRDSDDAHWRTNPYGFTREMRTVTKDDSLSLPVAPGGGLAIRFRALPQDD
ncbi:glycoside hydrolase family 97 protein [Yunchengibacter salinarum]|uniref:glycoside hydrolase family 97 protein n=1 Tax=Yunchengibacter salinarum TaxID=3133399 RepID=UPI0035B62465